MLSGVADFDAIFKAYDVRGTYPDQIDAEGCMSIGAAFAHEMGAPLVVVGRDMRESGVELAEAFIEGVLNQGVDVINLGLASTDLLYFASGVYEAPGAMFTASHNPAQYNGIKMCRASAAPISADTGLGDIRDRAAARDLKPAARRGLVSQRSMLEEFAAHVHSFIDTSRLRPLKIVVDVANGMGGLVVPAVLGNLGFDLELMYPELDGTFPNHPASPLEPENIVDLQRRVIEVGADVGLAFDGDADRVFLVDERGNGVSGSATTAMVAAALLDAAKAEDPSTTPKIIYNLICSKTVPQVIAEHGGEAVRSRVGHSFIKQLMADTGSIFGGEHSGHYYFKDNFRADSGLIAAIVVLGLLSADGRPLSKLAAENERYAQSGELNTRVADAQATIERVHAHYAGQAMALDRLDGLTADFGDWWFNLRPSNTEPLLRLNLEAADPAACKARTDEVLALLKEKS